MKKLEKKHTISSLKFCEASVMHGQKKAPRTTNKRKVSKI